jgi:hypothetical protein
MEGEGDPAAPFQVRWRGTVPALARPANGGLVLDATLVPARLGARFVQVAARTTPLLVPVGERVTARIEIVAPEGHAPEPGPAGAVEGPFGTFVLAERADGRTLVREERLVLSRGRIAPDRYPDFAAFAAGVDHLQERPAAFTKREVGAPPAGSGGPPTAAR